MVTEIGWKDSFLLRIIYSVMSLPLPWMSSGGYLKFEYILRAGPFCPIGFSRVIMNTHFLVQLIIQGINSLHSKERYSYL